jgi:uncharacterized repeat protein (TIGR01451 family)
MEPNHTPPRSASWPKGKSPRKRRLIWARLSAPLIMAALIVAILIPVSSASSLRRLISATKQTPTTSARSVTSARTNRAAFVPVPFAETIETFAANCTTPKTSFNLGDTVCAKVTGAPVGGLFASRRFQWANTEPFVLRQTDIATSTQTDSFTLPTTNTSDVNGVTVDNRGDWTISSMDVSDGSLRATAVFSVRNPASAAADLSVTDVPRFDSSSPAADSDVVFLVEVKNDGPDAAANVSLSNAVPAGTDFVSSAQSDGPTFNCDNPSSGAQGTSICTISSLASGAKASFLFTYHVASGTADDTQINDTVDVTSATTEKNSTDNSSTGTAVVTTPTCTITPPADIVQQNDQDASGHALGGATITYADPTTSSTATPSSCGIVTCSPASGSFFPIGTTTVVCTDGANSPVHFNVTIQDTEAPTITCPADVTRFENPGNSGGAHVTYPDPVAVDNSGSVTITSDHPSGSLFPVGTTTVTETATDAAGHTASCTFNVTVTPSNCTLACPADVTQAVAAGETSAIVNYPDANTTGTCGTITYSQASGTSFPLGTTTVTATAENGQSCSFNVTVTGDTTAPVITCPTDITVSAAANACTASVSITPATATDNLTAAGDIQIVGQRNDGLALTDLYPVGTTVIIWTATDGAGNSSICQQVVQVNDVTPPSITAPAGQTVFANENCEAEVPDFTGGTVTSDTCASGDPIVVTQEPAAGTLLGAGVHTITLTATDGSGNHGTATTTFGVVDNTPPTLTLNGPATMTVECHTSFSDPGATAQDNCRGSFAATASGTVNVNVPGTYTITYNASDAAGNAATPVTRTVTVVDTTAPVIVLNGPNPMTVECHTSFTDPGAVANDGCSGSFAATASGTVNVNTPGTYTLTYRATDPAGNVATPVTRTVKVVDTTPPTITLNTFAPSLWPANHKYKSYQLTEFVTGASDSCNVSLGASAVVIEKVTSDEIENGNGDGNTDDDIVIAANCKSVQLRAEREGGGDGRVYTITFKVTDSAGNVGRATAKVVVPHNPGETPVNSGVHYTVNGTCP